MKASPITGFIESHFRHFNASALRNAAKGYQSHIGTNGKMLVALGGAMSTAELGVSLAAMIRQDKVHAISCTGANLEEDLFNLVAHDLYVRVPNYRSLTPQDDLDFFARKLNRVTDTCIPDSAIWARLEIPFMNLWREADQKRQRFFPYEFVSKVLREGDMRNYFQIDPQESWLLAAIEKQIPVFVPAWEDSSLGNMYAAACLSGKITNVDTVRSGIEVMIELANWYARTSAAFPMGFFQIGGGVAGDFSVCVVPMLQDDLLRAEVPKWGYFCQIGDSTTSYGSYSGATPSEKISWGKLDPTALTYTIESDATIVAPLIFAYVLGW